MLEKAAAGMSTWEVYATKPVPPALDPVDAAAFGSPSAVEGWFQARGLQEIVVAAIGGTTGAALYQRGHHADVVPERPDYAELLERLCTRMRARNQV
jgi:uroporphyrinogen-III synthase